MLLVHQVKGEFESNQELELMVRLKEKKCEFPAITHVDGSARIQTVTKGDNEAFHTLLSKVKEKTGYGMVINTSFNVRGEPVVFSPYDAYRCFMETNIDILAIGDCLLFKEDQPKWVKSKKKFKLD